MALVVLLNSLVESFDVFVWTLIALVYPLYISICAIEANSNAHNRKFLIYWIIYALIMLFEVTSAKLIEWIPLWSYIKLITACWLVLPRFDGAVYAYEYIVRPCISVEPQKIVDWFKIRREEFLLHQKDDFLLLAQRYIKENGSEALEKLIIEKSVSNAVETVEEAHEAVAATSDKGVTSVVPIPSSGVAKNMKVKHTEPVLTQTDHKTIQATTDKRVIELMAAAVGAGKDSILGYVESTHDNSKKAQKEWTCAICLVSTTNEAGLKDHVQGKKHKAKEEELRAINTANKRRNNIAFSIKSDQKPNQPQQMEQKNKANVPILLQMETVEEVHEEVAATPDEEVTSIVPVSSSGVAKSCKVMHTEPILTQTDHKTTQATTDKRVIELTSVAVGQKPNQPLQMEQKNKANVPILLQIETVEEVHEEVAATPDEELTSVVPILLQMETVEEVHEAVAAMPDEEVTSVVPMETVEEVHEAVAAIPVSSSGVAKSHKVKHTEPILTQTDHKTTQATTDKRVIELTAMAVDQKPNQPLQMEQKNKANVPILLQMETVEEVHDAVAATPDEEVTSVVPVSSSEVAMSSKVKHTEPILIQTDHTNSQATTDKREIELTAVAVGAGKGSVLAPVESKYDNSKKGRKEWSCAICLISTTNEADLKVHFQGKKHKAKKEELRAINTANKRSNSIALSINSDQKPNQSLQIEQKNKANVPIQPNPKYIKKQVDYMVFTTGADQGAKNLQINPLLGHDQNEQLWCDICNLQCKSTALLRSHRYGKKHKAKEEELRAINTTNKRKNNIAISINSDQKPNQSQQANVPILPNTKYIKKQQVDYKVFTTGADQGAKNLLINPLLGCDQNEQLRCDTCNLQCNSLTMLRSHLSGKKHLERCMIN